MNGAMNCILSTEEFDVDVLKKQLAEVPSMEGLALVVISVDEAYDFNEIKDGHRIALLDLGLKRSIAQCLADRGCDIRVFPWDSKAEDLLGILMELC